MGDTSVVLDNHPIHFPDVIKFVNPLTNNVAHPIETSQMICSANQWTGFYKMGNIGR